MGGLLEAVSAARSHLIRIRYACAGMFCAGAIAQTHRLSKVKTRPSMLTDYCWQAARGLLDHSEHMQALGCLATDSQDFLLVPKVSRVRVKL